MTLVIKLYCIHELHLQDNEASGSLMSLWSGSEFSERLDTLSEHSRTPTKSVVEDQVWIVLALDLLLMQTF